MASENLGGINKSSLEAVRDALNTCLDMSDHTNDGISFKAAEKGIAALNSINSSVLVPIPIPREHTAHEDCNCEIVGRAKGWNAACAALGLIQTNNILTRDSK